MPERQIALIVACLIAFLLGSVPFGLLIARLSSVRDLTQQGSGNIGATNVSRVLGFWPAGFFTLLLDLFKGALPALLLSSSVVMTFLAERLGVGSLEFTPLMIWAAVLCGVLGHCYSPWLHFHGGKGVATAFGALLILSPWAALIGGISFALVFAATRTASLSSVTGLLVTAVAHLVLYPLGSYLWLGATLILVILIRHEDNLDALLESREKSFN